MNKIICGDCVDIMKTLPDGYIDLTVTSPPYGTKVRKYHGFNFDFEATAQQLYRVMKPGAVLAWVVGDTTVKGDRTGEPYRQALYFKEIGFLLHDTIIINKSGTSYPSKSRYTACYEFAHVLAKGQPKAVNLICDVPRKWQGSWARTRQRKADGTLKDSTAKNCGAGRSGRAKGSEYGMKARTNIWPVITGKGFSHFDGDLFLGHPATFPTPLAIDLIRSFSNEGDLVLDPLNGSGTTCLAAKGLNRDYLGIDVSSDYCDLAERRVALVERGEYLVSPEQE